MKQEAVADLQVFRRVSDSTQLTADRRPKKKKRSLPVESPTITHYV